jgi:hypothetical protein
VDRLLEAGRAEVSCATEVAVVAVGDDGEGGGPRSGPERLASGVQRRRPDALQQVADLLNLTGDLGD